MFINTRVESEELTLLKMLTIRKKLSEKDKNIYSTLEKGFIGEQKFDLLVKDLPNGWLIISDLLLEFNNNYFQIDSLLISDSVIYHINVKNFEGDYFLKDGEWYTSSKRLVTNPFNQLNRSEELLRLLLQNLGWNIPIKSYLVFVNPEFQLYNASMDLPIIFPTQLNRFIGKLKKKNVKTSGRHLRLAEKLRDLHITKSPYTRIEPYSFNQMKKELLCAKCHNVITEIGEELIVCKCGCIEWIHSVVLRNVEEFMFLFPDMKVTTNAIWEWCGRVIPKYTIRKILTNNYAMVKLGRASYYVK